MRTINKIKGILAAAILGVAIGPVSAAQSAATNEPLDPDFARFVAAKEAEAKDMVKEHDFKVPAGVWEFFDLVQADDYAGATNVYGKLKHPSLLDRLAGVGDLKKEVWQPVVETFGAYGLFHEWDPALIRRFGEDVIKSVPTGAIYFGGTDPGRFVISALSRSQIEGKPFFILTQNQMVDENYLEYLRGIYGKALRLPSAEDVTQCFGEYVQDFQKREAHDKDPG